MATAKQDHRSALDWLYERRDRAGQAFLSDAEYQAGTRLRDDFERAHLMPRTTSSWSQTPGRRQRRGAVNVTGSFNERTLAARQRVRRALQSVDPDNANLLIDVCLFDCKLVDIERAAGWPQRSGKIILRFALRQLARHYGLLMPEDVRITTSARIAHWGVDGFRPVFEVDEDAADADAGLVPTCTKSASE